MFARRIPVYAIGLAIFWVPLIAGQGLERPRDTPTWEAVSVKPCALRGQRGGGTRLSPGRMALRGCPFYSTGTGGTVVEESARGQGEFLIIDNVERPTQN